MLREFSRGFGASRREHRRWADCLGPCIWWREPPRIAVLRKIGTNWFIPALVKSNLINGPHLSFCYFQLSYLSLRSSGDATGHARSLALTLRFHFNDMTNEPRFVSQMRETFRVSIRRNYGSNDGPSIALPFRQEARVRLPPGSFVPHSAPNAFPE